MPTHPITYFVFVDFENVPEVDLGPVAGMPAHIMLLLGKHQKRLDIALVQQIHLKGHPDGYQRGTGSKCTTRSSELMEEGSVVSEQGNFKVYHPVPWHICGGLGA